MSNKIIGAIFILMAGLIYTLERGFSFISTSILKSGAFAGETTGEMPSVSINGLFDNLFVVIFLILGVIFLIYGFSKTEKDK